MHAIESYLREGPLPFPNHSLVPNLTSISPPFFRHILVKSRASNFNMEDASVPYYRRGDDQMAIRDEMYRALSDNHCIELKCPFKIVYVSKDGTVPFRRGMGVPHS
jgi:hypothetical protein